MAPKRRGLASARKAAGYTQEMLAEALNVDRTTVIRWESGENEPQPYLWPKLRRLLGISSDELRELLAEPAVEVVLAEALLDLDCTVLDDAEKLRRELTEAVDYAAMSDASLDDWEHTVHRYGLANRYRPAASLLVDLTADYAELHRQLERRRAVLVPTRLTRVMAQMAGLMSCTLTRLDQQTAARNWARTAKLIANEAGDSKLHAWILATEAHAHYYNGNLVDAVYVATQAQHVANQTPCAGVANAAALEARAHALAGRTAETTQALTNARHALSGMNDEELQPSAFGYSEARLCFHAGNAYTYLGQTAAAADVHERALTLYAPNDYLDRALVMLDGADCLVHDNDIPAAADRAAQALRSLAPSQHDQLIYTRTRQVLTNLPAKAQSLPAVREVIELVQNPAARRES